MKYITEHNYLYLKPREDCEPIECSNGIFGYFDIYNENFEKVSCYDVITIKGVLRIDYDAKYKLFRLFPGPCEGKNIYYDTMFETLYSERALKYAKKKGDIMYE